MKRGPIFAGIVGSVVALLTLSVAVLTPKVFYLMRTKEYTAQFVNAAGLGPGADVHVAGVPAGRVTDVVLAGDHVRLTFRLDRGQDLGRTSSAAVKIATIMGKRYLAVRPSGIGKLDSGEAIPVDRTSVPYSLDTLGSDAKQTVDELDLPKLREMMGTMRQLAPEDPNLLGETVNGVGAAAEVLNRQSEQIDELLKGAQSVSTSMVEQQDTLVTLVGDADLVMRTLDSRRATIRQLIDDVNLLTGELSRFLDTNVDKLGPLLVDLKTISASLVNNEKALAETVNQLAPVGKGLANATGNGAWGDVAGPAGPIPDNLLCVALLVEGCR